MNGRSSSTAKILAAFLGLVALGAPSPADAVIIAGKDGTVAINLPDGWKQAAPPADAIQLMAVNDKLAAGVMVTAQDREVAAITLDQFGQRTIDAIKASPKLTQTTVTTPKHVRVKGLDAVRCELHCTVNNVKLAYVETVVGTEKQFLFVQAWTPESRFATLKANLELLASDVTELTPAPSAKANATVVIKGRDGAIELTVPAGWKQATPPAGAPAVVQLMAVNVKSDLGLMVAAEGRADSTVTLDQYAHRVIERVSKSPVFSDVTTTDPKPVRVNGQDAVQCELRCTTSKVKLAYLYTFIQTDAAFEYLDAWSVQSRFEKVRPVLADLANGLRIVKAPADK